MTMSKKKKIDWEKRQYEMASAIFFQDIKNYDTQAFPYNRIGEWDRLVKCAASDAVTAAKVFIRECRNNNHANTSQDG